MDARFWMTLAVHEIYLGMVSVKDSIDQGIVCVQGRIPQKAIGDAGWPCSAGLVF